VIAFVAFSLKRAWSSYWRNKLMSIAATFAMVLMLSLLSGLYILLNGLDSTLNAVEQQVQVVAYLQDSASSDEVNGISARLQTMPEVKSIVYVSKEQALKDFQARQPEVANLINTLPGNPLPASFEIGLRDPSGYDTVAAYLRSQNAVSSVQDIKATVNQLVSVMNTLRTGGIVILVVVAITVLLVIVNTIRLAVVARAQEIEIMRLVGASDAFIRWPFVFEGALVGLFGALITIGLLMIFQDPLAHLVTDFFNVLPVQANAIVGQNVALIVLVTGIAVGMIGSYVSVRSYLSH
jgi:cell division transport system permease protein